MFGKILRACVAVADYLIYVLFQIAFERYFNMKFVRLLIS